MQTQTSIHVVDFQRERAIRLWKAGKIEESRDILQVLLAEPFALTLDEKLKLASNLSVVEREAGRLTEALRIMLEVSPLAEVTQNEELKGLFHNSLAIVHAELRNYDQAFQEFTAASVAHEKAGNLKFRADIESNIGNLLILADNPRDAFVHLDRASELFTTLGEFTCIAQVNETRARAYLCEGNVDRALDCSLESVTHLRGVNEPRLLIESLETLASVSKAKRVHDALLAASGSITHAARLLGIPHNTSLNHLLETKYPQFLYLRRPKSHSRRKK